MLGALRSRLRAGVGRLALMSRHRRETPPLQASPFGRRVAADGSLPRAVLELGCGAGRDAVVFAAGRPVVGLDTSPRALRLARTAGRWLPVDQRPMFLDQDVTDVAGLRTAMDTARGSAGAALLVYARLVLDELTAGQRDVVLSALAAAARRGDAVAIELRVDKVDGDELAQRLTELGWTLATTGSEGGTTRVIGRRTT